MLGDGSLKIFTGTAYPQLAASIAAHLRIPLGKMEIDRFHNGEIKLMVNESVRGADVFIIQPTSTPVHDNLMEVLIMIDAFRRASAHRISALLPFYAYARQDRKTRGREPIAAKLVANLITTAGADRLVTVDLHAGQIQGFFDIPVDHLSAIPILAEYVKNKRLANVVVVSPDTGGVARARDFAARLEAPIAIVDKRRPVPGVAEVLNVIGDVEGRTAVIIDDIIDTAGSVVETSKALSRRGALEVYVCCTHPVLSGPAYENLATAPIRELVVTDSIPLDASKKARIKVLSLAPLLGEAIIRIHEDLSVSELFQ